LGKGGAEKLPGSGAMLLKTRENPEPSYFQGSYMPPDEIERIIHVVNMRPYNHRNKFEISLDEVSISAPKLPNRNRSKSEAESQELTNVILWALCYDTISILKIQRAFRMGNRAVGIMDMLFELDIVGEKYVNLARVVLPQCIDDLLPEVMNLLADNGITIDAITEVFNQRFSGK
jgi:DNA segregation ATPase FtsK/SpoIIIE-like protein